MSDAVDASGLNEALAESSLRSTDLNVLSAALLSIVDDEIREAAMDKAVRAVERLRRRCGNILEGSRQDPDKSLGTNFITAVRQYLVAGIELVEDLLEVSTMVWISPHVPYSQLMCLDSLLPSLLIWLRAPLIHSSYFATLLRPSPANRPPRGALWPISSEPLGYVIPPSHT